MRGSAGVRVNYWITAKRCLIGLEFIHANRGLLWNGVITLAILICGQLLLLRLDDDASGGLLWQLLCLERQNQVAQVLLRGTQSILVAWLACNAVACHNFLFLLGVYLRSPCLTRGSVVFIGTLLLQGLGLSQKCVQFLLNLIILVILSTIAAQVLGILTPICVAFAAERLIVDLIGSLVTAPQHICIRCVV